MLNYSILHGLVLFSQMTDAHIFNGTTTQNNESQKICNNVNGLCASNKTTHTNSMKNQTRNFSDSEKDKEMSKLCLQAENSTVCLNNTNQTDCNEKNCSTVALNRDENLINKMQKNTMSKYVLNNKATEKLKGHFKNSLKRKRRSFTGNIENNKKPHVPEIYEVIEDQNKERGELNLPKFEPSEIIKNTDILEFPVETLRKTEKPHYNKLQKGEPRRYHPKNNDQYFHKSEIREDTDGASDENSSQDHQYRDDEYETLREKITQKGARDLPVNLNRRHHLPKTTEVIEESAEVNIREKPEREDLITYRDANDDRHDKNYRSGERLHEDIKSSNNDSPRESIRSYADNYKISNDEQSENDSEEIINKNYSSLEDEEEDEEDSKDVRFHENQKQTSSEGRKQEYHNENTKNINKDQFSYEDDENDEEPSRNLKKNENLQVPNNNLRTQNKKFYNGINPSPASKKSGNFKDEKDERSEDSEEDEGEDDDDKPLGNFKKEENVHVNKPPVSHTLEGHHQKYNDEYFSLAPKRPNKDNENYKKDEENDDDDSTENLNIDREHREYLQPQINFKNKNYAEGSKKSAKKIDDNNEKRDSYKEKQGQENVKHDVSIHEYKKPNLISQKQSQFFNNDNNGYSLLQPKKLNEELNERQRPNKENGFNVNTGTIKSFSREVDLPTVTEKNTPLLSYRTDSDSEADSEKSQENNSRLKYASQPIDISGTVGRPDIQIKASIENGIRHLLTSDRPIYANTDFGSNFHDNFTDNKQKETTIPNDNYNENPSLYRKQVQKSLENSKAVQEVDLSNFSYDKFRGISDVDEFEPVTHKEEASTIKPKIKKKNRKNANIRKSNKNKPIHIHVPKPVKYVSNENIKEENKRHYNEDLSDNYQRTTSKGGKHRKSNSNKKTRNPKVKSLNYNQAAAKSDTSDKVTESEGTLDTLSPNTNEFDENLKIKFGDVNIKLPEIKLPKDILSYSNEDQVSKDKIKSKHYTYAPLEPKQKSQGNTESINPYDPTDAAKYSEQQKPKGDKPADEYDFFASYINKPHEGSHSDDAHNGDIEDGEDLYERFVRERFGRKDSFKERSEKLKEKKDSENKPITKNKELFDNIQKAIKRAEEVQKEAQKSKDPKANYLWTLEYGEKL